MCVSAVTDEMIAEGTIETVKRDGGILQTITDKNGYPVSENRFHHITEESETDYNLRTLEFYRSYSDGELYKTNLSITMNTSNRYDPTITAKGVGQMTKTELGALVNAVFHDEYAITDVKQDKWGYIEKVDFSLKEVVEENARFAKKQEMAKQLIPIGV